MGHLFLYGWGRLGIWRSIWACVAFIWLYSVIYGCFGSGVGVLWFGLCMGRILLEVFLCFSER